MYVVDIKEQRRALIRFGTRTLKKPTEAGKWCQLTSILTGTQMENTELTSLYFQQFLFKKKKEVEDKQNNLHLYDKARNLDCLSP